MIDDLKKIIEQAEVQLHADDEGNNLNKHHRHQICLQPHQFTAHLKLSLSAIACGYVTSFKIFQHSTTGPNGT
jgi:hypothetical protein